MFLKVLGKIIITKDITMFQTGHFPGESVTWESEHAVLGCVAEWFGV
jgi:hypothetical protein